MGVEAIGLIGSENIFGRGAGTRRRDVGRLLSRTRAPAPVEQLQFARGLVEGVRNIGGVNLDNVGREALRPGALRQLRRSDPDLAARVEAGNAGIEELLKGVQKIEGFKSPGVVVTKGAGALDPQFAIALRDAGVITGTRETGQAFSFENLQNLRQGFFPQARQIRESFGDLAARALGVSQPGRQPPQGAPDGLQPAPDPGQIPPAQPQDPFLTARQRAEQNLAFDAFGEGRDDPFVQAELENLQQEIRGSLAARGLNQAGASAVLESTQGIRLLEQLGQQRRAEGLSTIQGLTALGQGAAQVASGLSIGNLGVLGAGLQQQFGQRLAGFELGLEKLRQQNLQARGREISGFFGLPARFGPGGAIIEQQFGVPRISDTQLIPFAGSLLGGMFGGGAGAAVGGNIKPQGGGQFGTGFGGGFLNTTGDVVTRGFTGAGQSLGSGFGNFFGQLG